MTIRRLALLPLSAVLVAAGTGCVGQLDQTAAPVTSTTMLITVPSTTTAPLPLPPDSVTHVSLPRGACDPATVDDAHFDSDVATLAGPTPDMVTVAKRLIDLHTLAVAATISLVGHTDSRASRFPGGNDALSVARAETVAQLLVDLGVDRTWIVEIRGAGATEPIEVGDDPASLAANRRVEVTFHCPD